MHVLHVSVPYGDYRLSDKMRYIAPLTNFGGVRCWLLVGLASVNELSEVTVTN